jgi:hypothetical protein
MACAPDTGEDGFQDGVTKTSFVRVVEDYGGSHMNYFLQSSCAGSRRTITIVKKYACS